MEEDQETTQQPQENQQVNTAVSTQPAAPRKRAKPVLIVMIILSIILILGGIFYFLGSKRDGGSEASPTPGVLSIENEQTSTPEPTESTAPVDKSNLKVQILNGTGITGEAAFLESKMKSLGFTKVEVGNADAQNATATSVTFSKNTAQSVIDEVTKELQSIYQQVTTKTSTSGSFDIVITTGLRKGQTTKPQATTSPRASVTPRPSGSPTPTPRTSPSPSSSPTTYPTPTAT